MSGTPLIPPLISDYKEVDFELHFLTVQALVSLFPDEC